MFDKKTDISKNEDSVVSLSQEEFKKLKKKKLTKIIAITLVAVIGLGIIATALAGFLTMNEKGSFFYNLLKKGNLSAPKNIRIDDFDQETSFLILIKWDEIFNATDYTLETKYELYPDEIFSYDVELNGRYVERKRGLFEYRVRANNLSGEGEYTDWKSLEIAPMQLELPQITLEQQGNNVVATWTEIKFTYLNETRGVYYEVIESGYRDYGDELEYWDNNESPIIIRNNRFEFTGIVPITDVFRLKIRPVNYSALGGQVIEEPEQLFDIYETPDQWAEAEIVLEK